jgi:hypothetical protein
MIALPDDTKSHDSVLECAAGLDALVAKGRSMAE